ncbi:hypothetical protein [Vagococcus fluvialis]|uniref:hypothetical protein n=1 Tax=Vagococcus fluvialis TaxID=2738 RepID=UPI00379412C4
MYRPRYLDKPKDNLLVIELKDIDSVPKVYYKGERVFSDSLISVDYNWRTRREIGPNSQNIKITGYDLDGRVNYPVTDTINKQSGVFADG